MQELYRNNLKHSAKSRSDLAIIETLLKFYGNPHLAYPTIHIAGTNGKGQVAAKVSRALSHAGYRVGLFTSPHITDYAERITVNGQKIPQDHLSDYYCDLTDLCRQLNCELNFFELTTIFGFRYFQHKQVDIAVIEAGLGGRIDTTNVVRPLVSSVTSVSLDHTDILGETIDQIAWEKAGVIKERTPIVLGPHAQFAPLFQTAHSLGAPVSVVELQSNFYDIENGAIAREILSLISGSFPINPAGLKEALEYRLPCRFEKRGKIIYDVAHNPDGFARLALALSHFYPDQKFRFVIGMSKKKNWKESLKQIEPLCEHVHFVESHPQRGAQPKELAAVFEEISHCSFSLEKGIFKGVKHAKAALKKEQLLIICGSFYLMNQSKSVHASSKKMTDSVSSRSSHSIQGSPAAIS